MRRVVEVISPIRMGIRFRWLLASSWVSNLGDGIALSAGPLLVASQTRDPFLVALATLLQRLPWLVFGLYSGVVADRVDRRRLVAFVDLLRAIVLVLLATIILGDRINLPMIFVALFLLGVAETFADNTTDTLVPMVLGKADLGVGNARLIFGHRTINELIGVPVGAVLFGLGMFVPFVVQAMLIGLSVVLIMRIGHTPPPLRSTPSRIRGDIAVGARWLWGHSPMRTLALTIFGFNITYGAAWSLLVLYALERLQTGELGFALLTASSGVGGIIGAAFYGRLEARYSLGHLMRACLSVETATHLALANITIPWLAMLVLLVFGVQTSVWGATARAVRQRAVPNELQGRVGSVYMAGLQGGLVLGALVGGVVADFVGITGPFWFGFAGSLLMLTLIWNRLTEVAHNDTVAA